MLTANEDNVKLLIPKTIKVFEDLVEVTLTIQEYDNFFHVLINNQLSFLRNSYAKGCKEEMFSYILNQLKEKSLIKLIENAMLKYTNSTLLK